MPTSTNAPARRLHVLLIESDPDVRFVMDRMLTASAYDVHTADSVEQARQVAGEMGEDLDVVVSPLALPDGDGLGLMTELHDRYGCRTVCLTECAETAAEESCKCAHAGIDRCIPRPTGFEKTRAAIARASAAADGRN